MLHPHYCVKCRTCHAVKRMVFNKKYTSVPYRNTTSERRNYKTQQSPTHKRRNAEINTQKNGSHIYSIYKFNQQIEGK